MTNPRYLLGPTIMDRIARIERQLAEKAEAQVAPMCRAYRTSDRSVANSTWYALALGSESYDPLGMHDNSTNPSRIVAPVKGVYHVGGCVEWDANASGTRKVAILINGTTTLAVVEHGPTEEAMMTCVDYAFDVDDYAELIVYQDSGGGLLVKAQNNGPAFWMHKVGYGKPW